MAGQGNDFFLQFGSDAEPFSRQLAADLDPGIAKINALRTALEAYEKTAAESKGGSSPLGLTFEGLDQAAARIEKASTDFSRQFGRQIESLTSKVTGLAEILNSAARVATRGPAFDPAAVARQNEAERRRIPAAPARPAAPPTPARPAVLDTRPKEPSSKASDSVFDRYQTKLDQWENSPEVKKAQSDYAAALKAHNAAIEKQTREWESQKPGSTAATQVTPADEAAARKGKQAREQEKVATEQLANANTATAKDIKETSSALSGLNDQLRELIDTAKSMSTSGGRPSGDDAHHANADASLQIGNTTANPVPVVVVGGEAQATTGHPPAHPGHHGPTPTATTATSTAAAQEHIKAVEAVNAQPNSWSNPRRVTSTDRVERGEYYLLPGQEKPSRSFTIRKDETIGQHEERVGGIRARTESALAGAPKLPDEQVQLLRDWAENYGRLPTPKRRIDPSETGGSFRNQEQVRANEPYTKEVRQALEARDTVGEQRHGMARYAAIDELRRDPKMSIDGKLDPDVKSALAELDQEMISGLRGKFDRIFGADTVDNAAKKDFVAGARQRNQERSYARKAAQDAGEDKQAMAAWMGNPGQIDPITGEWVYAKDDRRGLSRGGVQAINERRDFEFRSDIDVSAVNEAANTDEAKKYRLDEQRMRAHQSRANADAFNARLGRLKPATDESGREISNVFVDPEDRDENGNPRRFTKDDLHRQFGSLTGPLQGDLQQAVARARTSMNRNRANGNPAKAAEYEQKLVEARNLQESISAKPTTLTPEQQRDYKEKKDAYSASRAEHEESVATAQRELAEMEAQASTPSTTITGEVTRSSAQKLASLRRTKAYKEAQARVTSSQEQLSGLKAPKPPVADTSNDFERLQRAAQRYADYRIAQDHRITQETQAAAPDAKVDPEVEVAPNVAEGKARPRRGGPAATQAEGQASTAVRDAEQAVTDIAGKIAALNKRLARTKDGSKNRESLEARKAKLVAARKAANRELSKLRNATEGTGSKTEQVDDSPEGLVSRGLITEQEAAQLHARNGVLPGRAAAAPAPAPVNRPLQLAQNNYNRASKAHDDAVNRAMSEVEEPENFNPYDHEEVVQAEARLKNAQQRLDRVKAQTAGGGGGNKPPVTPPAPPASPEPEEPPKPRRVSPIVRTESQLSPARANQFGALDEHTQAAIQAERQRLAAGNLTRQQQQESIYRAAYAFRGDSQYSGNPQLWGPSASSRNPNRVRSLASMLGLDESHTGTRSAVQQAIMGAGRQRVDEHTSNVGRAEGAATSEEHLAAATERAARMEEIIASSSGKVREARLREFIAEENLARLRAGEAATIEQIARAEAQLSAASRSRSSAEDEATATNQQSTYARITGRKGNTTFGQDLIRHGSNALTNTIGYSLVFTGFEKLRELVQTGIETQAIFVRLQASLDANGVSAGNLRSELASISANTATPLDHVIEAAAELSGTLQTSGDISFGTNIAAQLANISQGALTAKEAAVGLRDVIAAYGDEWADKGMTVKQGLQTTGDQIAHLSQLTGVSVKDITEGTTQIAQEANEFGLSQRQAATLAAYITKGTGESGEESAAQASRMLATLYNGKTQKVLTNTRLYGDDGKIERNPDGSIKTLASNEQFAAGDVGGVLQNIASNWEDLSPSERQLISASMGTGVQARAFSAYVGGGKQAAAEMGGSADGDQGALNKQNETYLQTVAGMIKQLDEDFQNLGSTLQRLGAFDAIGVLAKSLDTLLAAFNATFGRIASLMESNPITSGLMKWSVVILEAAAAWKLFGGAMTGALVRMGPLRNLTPSNAGAIREAEAANAAGGRVAVPAAQYGRVPFRQAAGGVLGSMRGIGSRYTDRYYNPTLAEQPLRGWRDPATPSDARWGRLPQVRNALLNIPNNVNNIRQQGFTNTVSNARQSVAAMGQNAYMNARYGRVVNPGSQGFQFRGSEVRAALREQASVVQTARATGKLAPGETMTPLTSQAAANDVKALRSLGLSAQSSAVLIRTSAEEQSVAMNSLSVRMRSFAAGIGSSLAGFAAMAGLFIVIGAVMNNLSGARDRAKERDTADNNLIGGSTSITDYKKTQNRSGSDGFFDWYYGGSKSWTGQLGNAVKHTGQGVWNGIDNTVFGGMLPKFGGGQAGPSDESNQQYLDLLNNVYGNPTSKNKTFRERSAKEGIGPNKAGGIDEKLPTLTSADDVKNWSKAEAKYINEHAKAIEAAGGNDKNSKAQIAYSINMLRANLKTSTERRLKEIEGLAAYDQLNMQQVASLSNALGQVQGLNANTLSQQSGAVGTLLNQSGLPTNSTAYKALTTATQSVPLNTMGINNQGRVGRYSADGTFHPASAQETAGIGPTEGSHLAKLGNGPVSGTQRLQGLSTAYDQVVKNAQAVLDSNKYGVGSQQYTATVQALQSGLTGYQQVQQQLAQAPITQAQGAASLAVATGGTPKVGAQLGVAGGDATAIKELGNANTALQSYNDTLDKTDPQYWQNLQQIQANKLQIAQLQNSPEINKLMIAAASATDASAQAAIRTRQARIQLQTDTKGGASSKQIADDQAAIAGGKVGERQASQNVTIAQEAVTGSTIRNSVSKAQNDLTNALQLEGVYAKGGTLQDKASYLNAIAQANQAQLAIQDALQEQRQTAYDARAAYAKLNAHPLKAAAIMTAKAEQAYADAVKKFGADSTQANNAYVAMVQAEMDQRQQIEDQKEARYDATAALQKYHGDETNAARTELGKAQQAYRFAVDTYGKNSQQASEALASLINARAAFYDAVLAQTDSRIDYDIATLNARGQAGDDVKAAQDQVTKVQLAIQSYLRQGGKKGTKEYNDLMGQLATAQRTAFDTALQAQLDTLDFQQQTYQITSAQEVASLQQILKNKQLTLKEQRDITLKIKSLQDSIREQLTQGGLNIPSDIKLPTAYDVRRSIGAGFGGAGTSVNTVNNNQQVTVYNQVPNATVANTIADQVITLINQQTSMGLRASSSTPRTVATK